MNVGIRRVGIAIIVLFVALVAQLTYLQVAREQQARRTIRATRASSSRDIRRDRGPIVTADGVVVAQSVPTERRVQATSASTRTTPRSCSRTSSATSRSRSARSASRARTRRSSRAGPSSLVSARTSPTRLATKPVDRHRRAHAVEAAQGAAAVALAGRRGCVVVLDVQHRRRRSPMYSNPTFDPNLLATHDAKKAQAAYAFLLARARQPAPRTRVARALSARLDVQDRHRVDRAAEQRRRRQGVPASSTSIPLPQTNGVALDNFGGERCGGIARATASSCRATPRSRQVGLDLGDRSRPASRSSACSTGAAAVRTSIPAIVASTGPEPGTFQTEPAAVRAGRDRPEPGAVTPMQMALVAEAVATGASILRAARRRLSAGPERPGRAPRRRRSSTSARSTPRPRRR